MLAQWKLNPEFQLCWKEWDNQLIIYHTGSGDTHLFNQLGYHILKLLKTKPMTTVELRAKLLLNTNGAVSREYETADPDFNEFLNDMQRLGIVEQVDS